MARCKDCMHYEICIFRITGYKNELCLHFLDIADFVEVDKVAEMFAEQFGDECPCDFKDNDEWLTLYCDYTNTCDCPCKDGWKQFIKHYDKRKEQ